MSQWENYILRPEPYVPGEQPAGEKLVKLNTNENPYPPSPKVTLRLETMDAAAFRKYPDPSASILTKTLAENYGIDPSQIFVGVGSDDVLAMAFLTFFHSPEPVVFPDITYSFYPVWADLFQIPYRQIPLDEQFCIHKEDYYGNNGGVVFPNPNAPTGLELPFEDVEDIVANNPDSVVIVDEAYIDFGGVSVLPLIQKYENLLVVQTFSKSRSMAGMRIGYAMGSRKLIEALENVKYSFNSYTMNQAALELGAEAVQDPEYFRNTLDKIIKTREETKAWMRDFGFTFPDSKANFLFVTHPQIDAAELFEALKKEQIYVRYFPKPRLSSYLRITIGTDYEMAVLRGFLKRYLGR
ncbi:MAG TPA: histidinol-phosphate transaminase [Candidatus Cottocaccamicrobium excrementipullorum]|nr:histidinol-phosphate transaminase [Candidatus Cottocaccamicrobium excrementipullorum]